MWLRASCNLEFQMGASTPLVLMLRPRSSAQQWVAREAYTLAPSVPVAEYTDLLGNLCQRLVAPPGPFCVRTSADVLTADEADRAPGAAFVDIQNLPDAVLTYLLPSRYCESDRFGALARQVSAGAQLGYDQVERISCWIHNTIEYAPGSSVLPLSAVEVHMCGKGVCRDLAHLGVAMCRGISIPARFVVGFLHAIVPMDLHAWFEAYVGGRWYTFDPTEEDLRGGRIAVAYGRDAADVPIYYQFGLPAIHSAMEVRVEVLEGPPE